MIIGGHAEHVNSLQEFIRDLDALRARLHHLIEKPGACASALALYELSADLHLLCRRAALGQNVAEAEARLKKCSECLARIHRILGLH